MSLLNSYSSSFQTLQILPMTVIIRTKSASQLLSPYLFDLIYNPINKLKMSPQLKPMSVTFIGVIPPAPIQLLLV